MSRSSTPARYPLLQKPLYVYTLPTELLNILSVRSVQAAVPEPEVKKDDNDNTKASFNTLDVSQTGSLSCQTCLNTAFGTLDEQRAHFRSDWHRYNAKLVLLGKGGMVTEEEFEEINDGKSRALPYRFLGNIGMRQRSLQSLNPAQRTSSTTRSKPRRDCRR